MRKNSGFLLGTFTGAGLALLATLPHGAQVFATATAAVRNDTYAQLNLFGEVFERIRTDYVEKPNDSKLVEGAINGMLSSLDPHSRYMTAKGWNDMQETTHGEFGGLQPRLSAVENVSCRSRSQCGVPASQGVGV